MRKSLIIITLAVCLGGNVLAATRPVAPAAGRRAQPIDIILSDFAFTPQNFHLHQGQTYQLRLVNRGSASHNLSAPEFFAAAQITPSDAAAVSGGKIEVGKGEARTVRLIPAAGRYGMTWTHFLHASFGMTGSITVD
ncbi:plastocyanin/azurin family copper-binding protein [Microvirga calopogonii]|uniref:plastocyanin/azurin family copper-binding protein n=1 Tax=Microvirga calopogonii TaxID=2078013 RepID=UPI0013B46FFA|nr:plastocyanin/azurin family copper-binding protein [Microvirga calopogonii]